MLRIAIIIAAVGCHREQPGTTIYALGGEPKLAPDTEILIGVVGDVDDRSDVRVQLVAEVMQRLPDLVIVAADSADEALAKIKHDQLTARGTDYGFAHVATADALIVVQHAQLARSKLVVDPLQLGRMNAAAIVRVRRDLMSLDMFGADGVTLH